MEVLPGSSGIGKEAVLMLGRMVRAIDNGVLGLANCDSDWRADWKLGRKRFDGNLLAPVDLQNRKGLIVKSCPQEELGLQGCHSQDNVAMACLHYASRQRL